MSENQLYRLVYLVLLLAVIILLRYPRLRRKLLDWRRLFRRNRKHNR